MGRNAADVSLRLLFIRPLPFRRLVRLIPLAIFFPILGLGQQVLEVQWATVNGAAPFPLEGETRDWLPALRMAVNAMPEESVISMCLTQSELMGLTTEEAKHLGLLFSSYYKRVRQTKAFIDAPSALAYCFSETKPRQGLATVYVPGKFTAGTKAIVFLHGYGGSLLAYLHYLSNTYPNDLIICPAYGISPDRIPFEYVAEAEKAVSARLHTAIENPLLIGLSAGGFAAGRLFAQRPESFRKVCCIAAYLPSDALARLNRTMNLRFIAGGKEPYVADGSFRQQMLAIKPIVRSLDWRIVDKADHFFLLSHEELTQKVLREWEAP